MKNTYFSEKVFKFPKTVVERVKMKRNILILTLSIIPNT